MSKNLKSPKQWRYTFEAHSHLPILKLFLFNHKTNPKTHCFNLNSVLNLQKNVLKTTWYQQPDKPESLQLLLVPLPNVLIDGEGSVQYKALDDHIQVKLVLLLPVDHPIFVNFDRKLSLNENGNSGIDHKSVSIDTDLKRLCFDSEGVCFYCTNCSAKLTTPIKKLSLNDSGNENGKVGIDKKNDLVDKKNVSIDTDMKILSFDMEGVCLYRRSCSVQLTRPIEFVLLLPNVFIDREGLVQYKVLDDHIEAKVVLLWPVDHPIFVNFDTKMSLNENEFWIDMDFKRLCFDSEGVCFYCRSLSAQLTTPIKSFSEMPSTDWSEVADNWFGGCCCSFGGIGDKMVAKYATSYASVAGTCLLSTTFILIYKDDLVRCNFSGGDGNEEDNIVADLGNANSLEESMLNNEVKHGRMASCNNPNEDMFGRNDSREAEVFENAECHPHCPVGEDNGENLSLMSTASELSSNDLSASGCCGDGTHNLTHITKNGCFKVSGTGQDDQPLIKTSELLENQKSFLNGFLGDIFMAKSSHLSEDVCWVKFLCPQCSTFIGAYPAGNGRTILDGGIRLFKCYVSTCLPASGSDDLFRMYSLERMFTSQVLENARTELSYRTVIRDRETKSAMLQIVLLNPNSFLHSGYCSDTNNKLEAAEKVDLSSATKVLFSDCSGNGVSGIRMVEEWVKKNQADEVYMFAYQIKELIKILDSAKDMFPFSCTSLQGLSLSSMKR